MNSNFRNYVFKKEIATLKKVDKDSGRPAFIFIFELLNFPFFIERNIVGMLVCGAGRRATHCNITFCSDAIGAFDLIWELVKKQASKSAIRKIEKDFENET